MHTTELKLRAIFATCALLLLAAMLELVRAGRAGQMDMLAALMAGLCIAGVEAFGVGRLTLRVPWRLAVAFLLGLAALYTLEV